MLKKLKQFKDKKEAEKWYEKKKEALKRLVQDPDFPEITEYWEREYEMIDNRLEGLKGRELEEAVIERSIIKKHLNWIENLTI